jgi:uncharacterized membrane protein
MVKAGVPTWIAEVFTEADLRAIADRVRAAEATTSAEIRVHLEPRVPRGPLGRVRDPLDRARDVFTRLAMHETRERNGVLVYLALRDHKLAIFGDAGVHARVGDAYWAGLRDLMVDGFRHGAGRAALVRAVDEVGSVLARHFPRRPDDVNELEDQVSVEP